MLKDGQCVKGSNFLELAKNAQQVMQTERAIKLKLDLHNG
jgi:hypothetical protein